jgi:hypothetical protein
MATTNTAGKETISIKVADKDIFAILRTFKVMDKIASDDLRNVAQEIAVEVKNAIISNASFAQDKNGKDISRQAIAVAKSVKVERDRIPKIAIGGSSVVTSSGARAGTLVFGVEFGSYNKKNLPARSPKVGSGNSGYFIFPTLKIMQKTISDKWVAGVDKIRDEWKGRVANG